MNFICDDPRIKAISFVGSNKAGEYIFARGTANGKRVQANLGAKNHGECTRTSVVSRTTTFASILIRRQFSGLLLVLPILFYVRFPSTPQLVQV